MLLMIMKTKKKIMVYLMEFFKKIKKYMEGNVLYIQQVTRDGWDQLGYLRNSA